MSIEIKNRRWYNKLHGGKADGKRPSDFDPDDISIGSKVQREHTTDLNVQKGISMDHLEENPEYYDELVLTGIADEKDAINTYNNLKTDDDKKKAIDKIQKHLNKEKEKLGIKEHIIVKFKDFINEKTHR